MVRSCVYVWVYVYTHWEPLYSPTECYHKTLQAWEESLIDKSTEREESKPWGKKSGVQLRFELETS